MNPTPGIPIAYQASLANPNTFQPDKDDTNNETIEDLLHGKHLPIDVQPPRVLMHQHMSSFLVYEIQMHTAESIIFISCTIALLVTKINAENVYWDEQSMNNSS